MLSSNNKKEEATGGEGRHENSLVSKKKLLACDSDNNYCEIIQAGDGTGTQMVRETNRPLTNIYCELHLFLNQIRKFVFLNCSN